MYSCIRTMLIHQSKQSSLYDVAGGPSEDQTQATQTRSRPRCRTWLHCRCTPLHSKYCCFARRTLLANILFPLAKRPCYQDRFSVPVPDCSLYFILYFYTLYFILYTLYSSARLLFYECQTLDSVCSVLLLTTSHLLLTTEPL